VTELDLEFPEQSLLVGLLPAEGDFEGKFYAPQSIRHFSDSIVRVFISSHLQPSANRLFFSREALYPGATYPTIIDMKSAVDETVRRARAIVVAAFAQRAQGVPGVREVRVSQWSPHLVVAAVTEDRSLDRDLELRAIFIELLDPTPDARHADLAIFSKSRGIPARVQDAQLVSWT
jgi:hypothetical protein